MSLDLLIDVYAGGEGVRGPEGGDLRVGEGTGGLCTLDLVEGQAGLCTTEFEALTEAWAGALTCSVCSQGQEYCVTGQSWPSPMCS